MRKLHIAFFCLFAPALLAQDRYPSINVVSSLPSGSCVVPNSLEQYNGDIYVCDPNTAQWRIIGSAATIENPLTINNSGSGASSGTTFNGTAPITISYNTIDAAPTVGSTSITTLGTIATGVWQGSVIGAAYVTAAQLNVIQTWLALQTFGTNISIGGVQPSGATGTGNIVFASNPTLTSASFNGATVPSGQTLTIANGGTLRCASGSTCPSSGTVSGQASGVIPLGNSATVIGSQSHIDDGVTTASTITSSEAIKAPSITLSGAPQIKTNTASNTDLGGLITLSGGTGTYTFAGTYTSAPVCTASDKTAANAVGVSTSTTVLTLTGTSTDVINYICIGRN